jgi:hypothetical protein
MKKLATMAALLLAVASVATTATGVPQRNANYEVTIYNLTLDQPFSPPVLATHTADARIFAAGSVAGDALRMMAEDGETAALQTELGENAHVASIVVAGGPIPPGGSASFEVTARGKFDRLSAVGMLVNTNDAFFGLDGYDIDFKLARSRTGAVVLVPAYDAGTERNSELCGFIPGPACGAHGVRDTLGSEGFVHVHRGIHGIGNLAADQYDWRNPVAKIVIRKLR